MNLVVNGRPRDLPDGSTVADLIQSLGYGARQVVVERNKEAVERARFGEIVLEVGDNVEIVRAVAGG